MREKILYQDTDGYKRVEFVPDSEFDLDNLIKDLMSIKSKNIIIHFVSGYVNSVRFTLKQFKEVFKNYGDLFSSDKIYIMTDYGTFVFKTIIVEYLESR